MSLLLGILSWTGLLLITLVSVLWDEPLINVLFLLSLTWMVFILLLYGGISELVNQNGNK